MPISIQSHFAFELDQPTDVLLQFEAAAIPEQQLIDVETTLTQSEHCARVAAQDGIGERIWIRASGHFEVSHRATATIERIVPDIATLRQVAPHDLPGETIKYLFDSRFCAADRFQSFVEAEFGGCHGGERIAALREWIAHNFTYERGSSTATTTALDSFIERRGVCRDFAHVMVTLARASTIPARYVACYAPGVEPQDFHAIAEVFLEDRTQMHGGAWHLIDATGMANPAQTVKIGVGRDAADVSFMTTFGTARFLESKVSVLSS